MNYSCLTGIYKNDHDSEIYNGKSLSIVLFFLFWADSVTVICDKLKTLIICNFDMVRSQVFSHNF